MKEKRKVSRVLFSSECLLMHGRKKYRSLLRNVSLGGLAVMCEGAEISWEDIVEYEIGFGSGVDSSAVGKISGSAKVVHSEEDVFGLQFVSMDEESFVFLKRLIALNLGDEDLVLSEFEEYIRSRA